ncbi:lysylphosphatidylglycerol synthase transmembrane domain-containing protein [Microbacterium sp. BWT-B31]|uniref:lysylphosphatidylglycerol synthase domain-containing protein n=1 Tax=Microbacterium sp. BWT-B31 TaxID=3232072 RepID=UPI0035287FCF
MNHPEDDSPQDPPPAGRSNPAVKAVGWVIAAAAIGFCVWALWSSWPEVETAVRQADLWLLAAAVAVGGAGLVFQAFGWRQVLALLGDRHPPSLVLQWFFAGEVGKYVPGGVWAIVGRSELARRGGVDRRTAYIGTLLSLGLTVVGAMWFCAIAGVFASIGLAGVARFAPLLLLPAGALCLHPAVVGLVLRVTQKVTKRDQSWIVPTWSQMLAAAAITVPGWALTGVAAVLVAMSLGPPHDPGRIAFAAVAAWAIGIVAVPVPAGAGLREVVFAAISGIAYAPAVLIAAVSRLGYVLFDLVAAAISMLLLRRSARRAPGP